MTIMLHRISHSYPARFAFLLVAGSIALTIRQGRILLAHIKQTNGPKV